MSFKVAEPFISSHLDKVPIGLVYVGEFPTITLGYASGKRIVYLMHKFSDGTCYVDRNKIINVELEISHLLAHRLRRLVGKTFGDGKRGATITMWQKMALTFRPLVYILTFVYIYIYIYIYMRVCTAQSWRRDIANNRIAHTLCRRRHRSFTKGIRGHP